MERGPSEPCRHEHQIVCLDDRREGVAARTRVDHDLGIVIYEPPDLPRRPFLGSEHEYPATGGGRRNCSHSGREIPLPSPSRVQVVAVECEDDALEVAPSGRDGEDRDVGQCDEVCALPAENDVCGKSRAAPADDDERDFVLRGNGC
ncbi:MAG: hypothetical protein HW413_1355 [Thermoleophilia bacterium]|nr:hypothetical protein [Thermoleophilia bacterium]